MDFSYDISTQPNSGARRDAYSRSPLAIAKGEKERRLAILKFFTIPMRNIRKRGVLGSSAITKGDLRARIEGTAAPLGSDPEHNRIELFRSSASLPNSEPSVSAAAR
jgi:hypothetical protein